MPTSSQARIMGRTGESSIDTFMRRRFYDVDEPMHASSTVLPSTSPRTIPTINIRTGLLGQISRRYHSYSRRLSSVDSHTSSTASLPSIQNLSGTGSENRVNRLSLATDHSHVGSIKSDLLNTHLMPWVKMRKTPADSRGHPDPAVSSQVDLSNVSMAELSYWSSYRPLLSATPHAVKKDFKELMYKGRQNVSNNGPVGRTEIHQSVPLPPVSVPGHLQTVLISPPDSKRRDSAGIEYQELAPDTQKKSILSERKNSRESKIVYPKIKPKSSNPSTQASGTTSKQRSPQTSFDYGAKGKAWSPRNSIDQALAHDEEKTNKHSDLEKGKKSEEDDSRKCEEDSRKKLKEDHRKKCEEENRKKSDGDNRRRSEGERSRKDSLNKRKVTVPTGETSRRTSNEMSSHRLANQAALTGESHSSNGPSHARKSSLNRDGLSGWTAGRRESSPEDEHRPSHFQFHLMQDGFSKLLEPEGEKDEPQSTESNIRDLYKQLVSIGMRSSAFHGTHGPSGLIQDLPDAESCSPCKHALTGEAESQQKAPHQCASFSGSSSVSEELDIVIESSSMYGQPEQGDVVIRHNRVKDLAHGGAVAKKDGPASAAAKDKSCAKDSSPAEECLDVQKDLGGEMVMTGSRTSVSIHYHQYHSCHHHGPTQEEKEQQRAFFKDVLSGTAYRVANTSPAPIEKTDEAQNKPAKILKLPPVRLRRFVPPRDDKLLCFRTPCLDLDHSQAKVMIESQLGDVSMLQCEPEYLQYGDSAKISPRVMWIFKLKDTSDRSYQRVFVDGLLGFEGEDLRVRMRDDVMQEERKAFELVEAIKEEHRERNIGGSRKNSLQTKHVHKTSTSDAPLPHRSAAGRSVERLYYGKGQATHHHCCHHDHDHE